MDSIEPDFCDSSHFVKLPYDLFGRVTLPSVGVYAGFRRYADHNTGKTIVAVETVARFLGVEKRAVERGIRELKRKGWIKRKRQGQGKPCVTTLKIPPTKGHLDTTQKGALSDTVTRTEKPNDRIFCNVVDFRAAKG